MTQQEYQEIHKALEDCTESIIESFDKFIQDIKNLRDSED